MKQDKEFLDTREAAAMLGRAPQTLRKWHCQDAGPLAPVVLNGRLRWSRAAIEKLHGIERDLADAPDRESRFLNVSNRRRGKSSSAAATSDSAPTAKELLDVMAMAYKLARGVEEHLAAGRVGSAKRTAALLITSLEYGRNPCR